MWPSERRLQAFKALSYRDMWRVSSCLWRGEAPADPRLAAAAVDLAEAYRREGRVRAAVLSWYPLFALLFFGYLMVSAATRGDTWVLIPLALFVPPVIAMFLLDPRRRPANVSRSLEASRGMLPAEWDLGAAARPADDDGPVAAGWYAEPDNGVVERLWDGDEWTSWARPRSLEARVESDPAGWRPHPTRPGREVLWSGSEWTSYERDAV